MRKIPFGGISLAAVAVLLVTVAIESFPPDTSYLAQDAISEMEQKSYEAQDRDPNLVCIDITIDGSRAVMITCTLDKSQPKVTRKWQRETWGKGSNGWQLVRSAGLATPEITEMRRGEPFVVVNSEGRLDTEYAIKIRFLPPFAPHQKRELYRPTTEFKVHPRGIWVIIPYEWFPPHGVPEIGVTR